MKRTGKGEPTRKTAGAIGDIYIDSDTGKKYECVFAYRDIGDTFDCQWKEILNPRKQVVESKNEKPVETAKSLSENSPGENFEKTKVNPVEEEKPKAVHHQNNNQNRMNYHKQYRPNNG